MPTMQVFSDINPGIKKIKVKQSEGNQCISIRVEKRAVAVISD